MNIDGERKGRKEEEKKEGRKEVKGTEWGEGKRKE